MEALEKINVLREQALADLQAVANADDLEAYRIKYLGAKGEVRALPQLIGKAPPDQRKSVGEAVNNAKNAIQQAFDERKAQAEAASTGPTVDVTEPGIVPNVGRPHLLMQVADELVELFGRMGFSVASGPEVEDEFHNFVALNIPRSHPARDPLDNFYLGGGDEDNQLLMRTQTSTVQIRVMETTKPPIRVVIPGRVYRPDTHDQTHLSMFHQLEALVVDKHVTMVDLKSAILQFVHGYFGEETKVRFRPSFFPFTEPSAEVDVWFENKQQWIELGGCGMVHPNVFAACGIDPEVYSGWAFGFGIERIAMRKYAIPDIRAFVENDVRFLRQF